MGPKCPVCVKSVNQRLKPVKCGTCDVEFHVACVPEPMLQSGICEACTVEIASTASDTNCDSYLNSSVSVQKLISPRKLELPEIASNDSLQVQLDTVLLNTNGITDVLNSMNISLNIMSGEIADLKKDNKSLRAQLDVLIDIKLNGITPSASNQAVVSSPSQTSSPSVTAGGSAASPGSILVHKSSKISKKLSYASVSAVHTAASAGVASEPAAGTGSGAASAPVSPVKHFAKMIMRAMSSTDSSMPSSKETSEPSNTTQDPSSSLHQDINVNNSTANDGFTMVVPKKKRLLNKSRDSTNHNSSNSSHIKKPRQPIFGVKNSSSLSVIEKRPRMAALFVSRLQPGTTERDIINSINEQININSFKCTQLKTKFDSYTSFHIAVEEKDFPVINNIEIWPLGCLLMPFLGRLNKSQIANT